MENSSHDLIWNVDIILLILVFLIPIQSEVWLKGLKKIKKIVKFCYSSDKEKLKLLIMKKKNQVRQHKHFKNSPL